MRNILKIPIFILIILISCNNNPEETFNYQKLDLSEALKNEKQLYLSEIVEKVEIIDLEATIDSYFVNLSNVQIGEKYIFIWCSFERKILLFDRQGKFLRKIGKHGKGPGETQYIIYAAIDKMEKYIVSADVRLKKLIKYSTSGKFLSERSFTDDNPTSTGYIRSINFIDENQFVVLYSRPGEVEKSFSRLLIYDSNLHPLQKKLIIKTSKELYNYNRALNGLKSTSNGYMYWEDVADTIKYFDNKLNHKSGYSFYFSKNGYSENVKKNYPNYSGQRDDFSYIWQIHDIPEYLFIRGQLVKDENFLIYLNKKTNELYNIPQDETCDTSMYNSPSIENDLFGLEPIYLTHYFRESNMVITYYGEFLDKRNDLDCLRQKKVLMPELHSEIVHKIANLTGEENPFLILLHLKK